MFIQKIGFFSLFLMSAVILLDNEKLIIPGQNFTPQNQHTFCRQLELPIDTIFRDTLILEKEFVVLEHELLHRPVDGTLFLSYRDTIQFFNRLTFTEYFRIVERRVPLKLIK